MRVQGAPRPLDAAPPCIAITFDRIRTYFNVSIMHWIFSNSGCDPYHSVRFPLSPSIGAGPPLPLPRLHTHRSRRVARMNIASIKF
jgi:hypothetical protein